MLGLKHRWRNPNLKKERLTSQVWVEVGRGGALFGNGSELPHGVPITAALTYDLHAGGKSSLNRFLWMKIKRQSLEVTDSDEKSSYKKTLKRNYLQKFRLIGVKWEERNVCSKGLRLYKTVLDQLLRCCQ